MIKDHTGTKIRKLIWLGDAVRVAELYQLATLHDVSVGHEVKSLPGLITISSGAKHYKRQNNLEYAKRKEETLQSHFVQFVLL